MVDYKTLKPGMYIQRGESLKAISNLPFLMQPNGEFVATGMNLSPETLAATVAWSFIALRARADEVGQVSTVTTWQRNETELEDSQLGFDIFSEMLRIDYALEVYGVAYYLKDGTTSQPVLRWLDPAVMRPKKGSEDTVNDTYTTYQRKIEGVWHDIDGELILRIMRKGLRELDPAPSAAKAAANTTGIMKAMDTTLLDFFAHNAQGMKLVIVPPGTQDQERQRLKRFFGRSFLERVGRAPKVLPVSAQVEVIDLDMSPNELALDAISDTQIDAILLSHGVPTSYRRVNGNLSTSDTNIKYTRSIVGRMDMIARTINGDPDVAMSGYSIAVHSNRLEIFQAAELQKAEGLQRLTGSPVMTVNEARERLDLEPMAGHDSIVMPATGFGALPVPASDVPDAEPSKMWLDEMAVLNRKLKSSKGEKVPWYYKRAFNANHLSQDEIREAIIDHDPNWAWISSRYP